MHKTLSSNILKGYNNLVLSIFYEFGNYY